MNLLPERDSIPRHLLDIRSPSAPSLSSSTAAADGKLHTCLERVCNTRIQPLQAVTSPCRISLTSAWPIPNLREAFHMSSPSTVDSGTAAGTAQRSLSICKRSCLSPAQLKCNPAGLLELKRASVCIDVSSTGCMIPSSGCVACSSQSVSWQ